MKAFTKVIYGAIDVQLMSALHIGDGNDKVKSQEGSNAAESSIAVDGEGHYILPATSIAGVSLHYIRGIDSAMTAQALRLLGNDHVLQGRKELQESRVYYYDARCSHVQIEWRSGVRMDHARGTAKDEKLYRKRYMSPGMTATIDLQLFISEGEEDLAHWIIEQIARGYHTGKIAMGMRTSTGNGRFCVTKARYLDVDLTQEAGLRQYLQGVCACRTMAAANGIPLDYTSDANTVSDNVDTYVLTAYCPEGLLIKSGEQQEQVDAANVFYTMAGDIDKEGNPIRHYYIPGTSIKGILRTYAERLYAVMHLNTAELDYLFGTLPDHKGKKRAGCIRTFDTDLENVSPMIHNRIKVDRFLGSVVNGAKMEEEILCIPNNHAFSLRVMIDHSLLQSKTNEQQPDPVTLQRHAQAVIFLALRDLGTGRVTLGSGSSIGHGRLQGTTLTRNQAQYIITGDQIKCEQEAETKTVEAVLKSLKGGATA